MPYGSGVLLVRDFEALGAAHSVDASYLQDLAGEHGGVPDFSAYSPELSRGFRGLRVWLPLHLHGVGAFREALDEKLDLALRSADALAAEDRLELVPPGPPELSTVAFRLRDGDDDANRALQDRVNAARRIFISSTVLDGRFTLRFSILSFRTHADRMDEAVDLVRTVAALTPHPVPASRPNGQMYEVSICAKSETNTASDARQSARGVSRRGSILKERRARASVPAARVASLCARGRDSVHLRSRRLRPRATAPGRCRRRGSPARPCSPSSTRRPASSTRCGRRTDSRR